MCDEFDKNKVFEFWQIEAEEALQVAKNLFEKENYSYSLFFGHLAIEKYLKAIYVAKKSEHAPYIHNLERLAAASGIDVDKDRKLMLIRISEYNIEARYPDIKRSFREKCDAKFVEDELKKIKELFSWLKSIIT